MTSESLNILLVEDNPADARLIQETIAEGGDNSIRIECVDRLSAGIEKLQGNGIDLVLLDLSLPDSQGLETLEEVFGHSPEIPIVILTGNNDEEAAGRALHQGAQDYLIKGQVDGNLLKRSIRYALERSRLRAELEQARNRLAAERESTTLERVSGTDRQPVTAEMFGRRPIRDTDPETHAELVSRYMDLLDQAIEKQAFDVDHGISGELRAIAHELSLVRAGPRDVVEIHSEALKKKARDAVQEKAQAYAEEARLMVLEVMGYLVSCYRTYTFGDRRAFNPAKAATEPKQKKEERCEV